MPPEPAADLFLIDEVAKLLRMEKKTLKRLINEGEFPRPLQPSAGIQVWGAEDVQYYRLRMAVRDRLRPTRKKPAPAKKPAGG